MPIRTLVPVFAAIALGCAPGIQRPAETTSSDDAAVRQVEAEVASATERNDADALAPYMVSDFTFVNPAGLLLTKDGFLDAMRTGRLHNTMYKVDEMSVRIYGTAAVVTYRSTVAGTAGMQAVAPQRRRTTMLIKRDGKWLIVAQQSTPMLSR